MSTGGLRTGVLVVGVIAGLCVTLVLVGCGATHEVPGNTIRGHALTIYTSLPLQGPSAFGGRSVLDGERLALAQAHSRIGQFTVALKALNDTPIARRGWDPGQVTQNAHLALQDAHTIAYLGDFNSGASAIAIPLLNRTGMLVLSPTSTAVGLTTAGLAASPGEPDKYYPTDRRTFVRLAPDDVAQAGAQVHVQRQLGCRATYVLNDGEFDGYDAATSFQLAARAAGLTVIGGQDFDPRAQDYASLALTIARSGANCVLISALPENHAALLARQIGAAMPHVKLFATSALAQPSFTDPQDGGIPTALASRVFITAPAARPSLTVGFDAGFARRYGSPNPYAVYGYESMRMVLRAIVRATKDGTEPARRSGVLSEVLGQTMSGGPLGTFKVGDDGATTLRSYGVFGVERGRPVLWYELP